MTRLQKILSVILAVQIVLTAVVFWPRTSPNAEASALLTDFSPTDITKFSIENDDGTQTEFARQGDGWVLATADDYPADSTKIEEILEKIAAVQTGRLVTRTDASHQRLQVSQDDFVRRIQLETESGTTETLYIGSSPNPRGTHIRRQGQDETYLTGDLANWEVNARVNNWIDTVYITLPQENVVSAVLENRNGTFEFDRISDTEWTLVGLTEDEAYAPTSFNQIIGRVVNLTMTEPLGTTAEAAYGVDTPQATLTLTVAEDESDTSQTYTLLVGATDSEDDTFIVKWSDSDYYVKVSSFNLETLVSSERDSFIQESVAPELEGIAPTPEG